MAHAPLSGRNPELTAMGRPRQAIRRATWRRPALKALKYSALALGAAPTLAQDFCGGVSANGQWIGGTEAASDVTAAASHMEQIALSSIPVER